jgi:DNA ligase-1
MVKIKPFEDAEAVIIGFEEQYENTNEPIINELGLTERSSHADGKIGKDTLGSFVVLSQEFGEFRIGTGVGLGEVLRKKIWTNKKEYVNKIIKFKYQKYGTKDRPRIPVFVGFRNEKDL